jgi:hypothetical protein
MEELFAPEGNAAAQGCEQLRAEQSVVRLSANSRVVFALQSTTCVTIVGPAPRLIHWWEDTV